MMPGLNSNSFLSSRASVDIKVICFIINFRNLRYILLPVLGNKQLIFCLTDGKYFAFAFYSYLKLYDSLLYVDNHYLLIW